MKLDLSSPDAIPALIVALYVITAIRYGFAGEWGRVVYWVCAGGITVAATWLVGRW